MKNKFVYAMGTILVVLTTILVGCSAPSSTPSSPAGTATKVASPSSAGTQAVANAGRVEVRVTDAPPNQDVTSVNVTVSSVEISQSGDTTGSNGGWTTMKLVGPSTFDLLQVQGLEQVLSTSDLAPGTYNQIRMDVTKIEVTLKGQQPQEVKLPSGKLRFVQPFDVVAGKTTVLLFDFDAMKSVNITGNGKIIFKPVIRLSVTKTPGGMQITTPALPNGEVNAAYSATMAAIGGLPPYSWAVSEGTLPPGLTLAAATGIISGTPTQAGDFSFTVQVEDSTATKKNDTAKFTVNIAAAGALQITTTSLPDGMQTIAYSETLSAVGGIGPHNWAIVSGSLPDGLTLTASTGVIAGTPTAKGEFHFTVQVTDGATPTASTDTQALALYVDNEVTPE